MSPLFLFLTLCLVCQTACFSQKKNSSEKSQQLIVQFYNTENFFDTLDDPHKTDNEFLPDSKHNWNTEKYFNKIHHLADVIDSVGGNGFPALIGLCEVENETVIKDLLTYSQLKNQGFDFKVTNSPDVRSIDVALIYDTKKFSLLSFKEISATNPEMPENKTRNILYAKLKFMQKEVLHVFVNHWPSMRDGEENSEPRRVYAATQLRRVVDSVLKGDPGAKIIIMGDLNETPDKAAVYETLGAKSLKESSASGKITAALLNPFYDLAKNGNGTHYYNKEWNVLDHIIFSKGLVTSKSLGYKSGSAGIFFHDMVLYTAPRLKIKMPNRTYSGSKYHNGYSDHLSVFATLEY